MLTLDCPLWKALDASAAEAVCELEGAEGAVDVSADGVEVGVLELVDSLLGLSAPPPLPGSATLSTVADTVLVLFILPTVSLAKTVMVRPPSTILSVFIETFHDPDVFEAVLLKGAVPLLNWNKTVLISSKASVMVALKASVPTKVAPAAGVVMFTVGAVKSTVKLMTTELLMLLTVSFAIIRD